MKHLKTFENWQTPFGEISGEDTDVAFIGRKLRSIIKDADRKTSLSQFNDMFNNGQVMDFADSSSDGTDYLFMIALENGREDIADSLFRHGVKIEDKEKVEKWLTHSVKNNTDDVVYSVRKYI